MLTVFSHRAKFRKSFSHPEFHHSGFMIFIILLGHAATVAFRNCTEFRFNYSSARQPRFQIPGSGGPIHAQFGIRFRATLGSNSGPLWDPIPGHFGIHFRATLGFIPGPVWGPIPGQIWPRSELRCGSDLAPDLSHIWSRSGSRSGLRSGPDLGSDLIQIWSQI